MNLCDIEKDVKKIEPFIPIYKNLIKFVEAYHKGIFDNKKENKKENEENNK